jgi:hypothetical protein
MQPLKSLVYKWLFKIPRGQNKYPKQDDCHTGGFRERRLFQIEHTGNGLDTFLNSMNFLSCQRRFLFSDYLMWILLNGIGEIRFGWGFRKL